MFFSKFREQRQEELEKDMVELDTEKEMAILADNNLLAIKGTAEYSSLLDKDSPTNRIITSLYSKERILFLL